MNEIEISPSADGSSLIIAFGAGFASEVRDPGVVCRFISAPLNVSLDAALGYPQLVAHIRDVADAELMRGFGHSWRDALEGIAQGDPAPEMIAETALEAFPRPPADEAPRVTLTRAGDDCERYRRVVENLVAWGAGHAVAMSLANKSDPLRIILDDARAALEAEPAPDPKQYVRPFPDEDPAPTHAENYGGLEL